ncbi:unnamed protein product, partial [Prunus brigantina]
LIPPTTFAVNYDEGVCGFAWPSGALTVGLSSSIEFTLKTDFEIWVFMQFTETVVLGWVHVLQIQKMEMLGSKLKHNCLSFSNTILSKPNATSEVCRDFSSFVPQCTKNKKKFGLAL